MIPPFSSWSDCARDWFGRKLCRTLASFRDSDKTVGWCRRALSDADVFTETMVSFCECADEFMHPTDRARVWMDQLTDDDWPVEFNVGAIAQRLYKFVEGARDEVTARREASAYPDLDAWLAALLAGKIARSGPSEPSGYTMVADATSFITAKKMRQRTWPRLCRTCSTEFKPDRGNVKHCVDCRAKRRAAKA